MKKFKPGGGKDLAAKWWSRKLKCYRERFKGSDGKEVWQYEIIWSVEDTVSGNWYKNLVRFRNEKCAEMPNCSAFGLFWRGDDKEPSDGWDWEKDEKVKAALSRAAVTSA